MAESPYDDPKVQHLRRTVASHLLEIAELFNGPMKLSFLARDPAVPDGSRDVLVSDDNPGGGDRRYRSASGGGCAG